MKTRWSTISALLVSLTVCNAAPAQETPQTPRTQQTQPQGQGQGQAQTQAQGQGQGQVQAQGQVPAPENGPMILDVQGGRIRVVPIASELVHPWSFAFLPSGDLLVAETNGRLRLIQDDELVPEPVWIGTSERGDGLKSIAVHPRFAENGFVYLAHPKNDGDRNTLAVSRGRLQDGKLEGVEEIFVADAWETSGNM